MAQARGEFRKAGLDVKIVTPSDPAAPLKLLAAGRADIAISYEPEVLLARDANLEVLSVGALAQQPLTSLMAVKGRSVDPKKLAGKRVGTAGIPYQDAYLDEILQNADVDPATVKRVNVGFNLVPAMLSGRVDATLGAFWNVEGVQLRLEKRRPSIAPGRHARRADRTTSWSSRPATTRSQHDGELLRRFMQALQRGTRAARNDPQARGRRAARRGARPRRAGSPRRASARRCPSCSPRTRAARSASRTCSSGRTTPTGCGATTCSRGPSTSGRWRRTSSCRVRGSGTWARTRPEADGRRRAQRALPDRRAERVRAGEPGPAAVGREQLAHLVLGRPRARVAVEAGARRTAGRPGRPPAAGRSGPGRAARGRRPSTARCPGIARRRAQPRS